jgi:N-acetylated-alpha-linked acidic dipeptidase
VIVRYGKRFAALNQRSRRSTAPPVALFIPILRRWMFAVMPTERRVAKRERLQRGSVADLPFMWRSVDAPGTARFRREAFDVKDPGTSLTKIPVLPISYSDALPLLRALGGPVAPVAWRGALPITYHLGPGQATVHLKLEFDFNTVPLYDVIARLRGSERPDEWVIRGNHHDAWVNGAGDPISGMIAVLAEAQAVSQLVKTGWRPRRTIIYCAWDGEEEALIAPDRMGGDTRGRIATKSRSVCELRQQCAWVSLCRGLSHAGTIHE